MPENQLVIEESNQMNKGYKNPTKVIFLKGDICEMTPVVPGQTPKRRLSKFSLLRNKKQKILRARRQRRKSKIWNVAKLI